MLGTRGAGSRRRASAIMEVGWGERSGNKPRRAESSFFGVVQERWYQVSEIESLAPRERERQADELSSVSLYSRYTVSNSAQALVRHKCLR